MYFFRQNTEGFPMETRTLIRRDINAHVTCRRRTQSKFLRATANVRYWRRMLSTRTLSWPNSELAPGLYRCLSPTSVISHFLCGCAEFATGNCVDAYVCVFVCACTRALVRACVRTCTFMSCRIDVHTTAGITCECRETARSAALVAGQMISLSIPCRRFICMFTHMHTHVYIYIYISLSSLPPTLSMPLSTERFDVRIYVYICSINMHTYLDTQKTDC